MEFENKKVKYKFCYFSLLFDICFFLRIYVDNPSYNGSIPHNRGSLMNIREYYAAMSRLYLHQVILCTIFFCILILPSLKITQFIPTVGVFIIIMIVYFSIRYLYFTYKSTTLPIPNKYEATNKYIMMDASIASYNWRLYTEDGFCRYSILKLSKKEKKLLLKADDKKAMALRIIDHYENKQWNIFNNRDSMTIISDNNHIVFKALKIDKREYIANNGQDHYRMLKSASYCVISKNGNKIMTISTGLMPLRMQKLFYSSTPIIGFANDITDYERHFCLGLFLK